MKVSMTFDFSDEDRAALANHNGVKSRDSLRHWMWSEVNMTLAVIHSDADAAPKETPDAVEGDY